MEIGSEWRGWTVAKFLGGGSFGKVYRIEREEFGYKYEAALKVIRIPHSDDEVNTVRHEGMTEDSIDSYFYSVVKGITSELALLSQLSGNSNIVSYEDHSVVRLKNEFGWEIYLRMELVTPLFEYLKGKAVTARDVIRLGIDISKALETCEKSNIIHRDIKPDNIFYSKQETYKLGDFGIARKLDKAAAEMTKVGTFSYMAPEVYKGQPYDHTVDIYSLGIILYQFMNRNRRPFMPTYPDPVTMEDNEQANMERLSGNDMPVPSAADEKLAGIILRACAYDPRDRYQNAEELRRDLESALDDEDANRIVFSECTEDVTRSISSAGGSSFDETVTMFGTKIGLDSESEGSSGPIDLNSSEKEDEDDTEEAAQKPVKAETAENIVEAEKIVEESADIVEERTDAVTEEETEKETNITKIKKKQTPSIKWLITIIMVVIAVCGALYWYFNSTVPDVIGKSPAEAEAEIKKAGLKVGEETEGDFSDEIEQGDILSQSVKNGKKVKRGTVIDLTISKGEEKSVPDLVNKKYDEAKEIAEGQELIIPPEDDIPRKWSEKIDKGCVVSQDPEKGTGVEAGTRVNIVISKGRKPIIVPKVDIKNKFDEKAAKKKIDGKGLKSVVTYEYDDSVTAGYVISQSPAANSKLHKGDTVTIKVSLGKKPVRKITTRKTNTKSKTSKKKRNNEDGKYK